eukprot:CAMPEP_0172838648 /NCGR_PEP_ID=MMETSP1075-20121228/28020_1 /TAXON_ID=2916 /ORGANISM="Ceratium fusus, Strain PA161109" /LENGTH=505 /DNA_ID=CAMNT_0013682187 /DNA_START=43 /DNA_END=1556 /DNA_ORIENTATION=+
MAASGEASHVFVLGLPKCGTTSLHHALESAGYVSVHWAIGKGGYKLKNKGVGAEHRFVGKLMERALAAGLEPLHFLPPGTNAVAQMDCLHWDSAGRIAGLFPQMCPIMLQRLVEVYPMARFILNVRPLAKWLRSVDNHNDMRTRLVAAALPDLPPGKGRTDAELWAWAEGHHANIDSFFAKRGESSRLLWFDIEEEPARATEQLSIFVGRSMTWQVHNATICNKASIPPAMVAAVAPLKEAVAAVALPHATVSSSFAAGLPKGSMTPAKRAASSMTAEQPSHGAASSSITTAMPPNEVTTSIVAWMNFERSQPPLASSPELPGGAENRPTLRLWEFEEVQLESPAYDTLVGYGLILSSQAAAALRVPHLLRVVGTSAEYEGLNQLYVATPELIGQRQVYVGLRPHRKTCGTHAYMWYDAANNQWKLACAGSDSRGSFFSSLGSTWPWPPSRDQQRWQRGPALRRGAGTRDSADLEVALVDHWRGQWNNQDWDFTAKQDALYQGAT